MKLDTIISSLRLGLLNDSSKTSRLWSDAELFSYIEETLHTLQREAFITRTTTELSLSFGESAYYLDESIVDIERVTLDNVILNKVNENVFTQTIGRPISYSLSTDNNQISFFPIPDKEYDVILSTAVVTKINALVYSHGIKFDSATKTFQTDGEYPLTKYFKQGNLLSLEHAVTLTNIYKVSGVTSDTIRVSNITSPNAEISNLVTLLNLSVDIPIPQEMLSTLKLNVGHLAYSKSDAEVFDPKRAMEYKSMFNNEVARLAQRQLVYRRAASNSYFHRGLL